MYSFFQENMNANLTFARDSRSLYCIDKNKPPHHPGCLFWPNVRLNHSQTSVPLKTTHKSLELLKFYKIRHSLVNISFPLSIRENPRPSKRRGVKYIQLPASVNAFGMSFLRRTIRAWNLLPGVVTASPTLLAFKAAALPAVRSMQAPGHMRRL